jgi:hypothetical protein
MRGVLERLLDAAAPGVEFPAVVLTADAVVLDHAVGQAGTAMGTVLVDNTELATTVEVDDQFLAKHLHSLRPKGTPE